MEMNTPSEDLQAIWKKYILGELAPEQAERMEILLQKDELMFQVYMQELMRVEEELPTLQDEDLFVESVYSKLPDLPRKQDVSSTGIRRRWDHPLFHYTIAASITLLLLGGGVFDRLSDGASEVMRRQSGDIPLSDQLMERTSEWMERMKPTNSIHPQSDSSMYQRKDDSL